MNKLTFTKLNLKKKEDIKEIDFNENKIEIKQYLPITDKLDLVDITLQKSKEDRLYNPLKIDMFFHLNLIYLYTNLTFTDKQREDENKLYDLLESNGLIDLIVAEIPEKEYTILLNKINEKVENELKYNTTAAAIISKIINDLPASAEAAQKIVNNFDKDKYQAVVEFARSANGDRPIKETK